MGQDIGCLSSHGHVDGRIEGLTAPSTGYPAAMMTMLGTMTTTSVLIAAEAATAARSAAASRFGAGPRDSRSWLHPTGGRTGLDTIFAR